MFIDGGRLKFFFRTNWRKLNQKYFVENKNIVENKISCIKEAVAVKNGKSTTNQKNLFMQNLKTKFLLNSTTQHVRRSTWSLNSRSNFKNAYKRWFIKMYPECMIRVFKLKNSDDLKHRQRGEIEVKHKSMMCLLILACKCRLTNSLQHPLLGVTGNVIISGRGFANRKQFTLEVSKDSDFRKMIHSPGG